MCCRQPQYGDLIVIHFAFNYHLWDGLLLTASLRKPPALLAAGSFWWLGFIF